MTEDSIKSALTQIRDLAQQTLVSMTPTPQAAPVIRTPEAFDTVMLNSQVGAVLTLARDFQYPRPLKITRPLILRSETHVERASAAMTADEPAPLFLEGIEVLAPDVALNTIDVKNSNREASIITLAAVGPRLSRVRALGHPTEGARRGIMLIGTKDVLIVDPWIDHIGRVGRDTQALYAQDIGPGVTLIGGRYSAAGQGIMFGGGDPKTVDGIPRAITVTGAHLTKQEAWYSPTMNWQIKCALELKNCIGFAMTDSIIEYGGTSEGQGGYLADLTPRNQDGMAPFTTVQDVLLERVLARHGAAGINILGYDDIREFKDGRPVAINVMRQSVPLDNVTLRDVKFEDVDPLGLCKMKAAAGKGWLFYMNRGPKRVTLERITAEGKNLQALLYCEREPPTGLVIKDWKMPSAKYAFHTPAGVTLASLKTYAPDAVIDTAPGTGAVGYPGAA